MKALKRILLALFFFPLLSSAIVVADYSIATNAPTGDYDLDWSNVYQYKNSSSVAVGEYWILTASHVADDGGTGSLTVGSDTYYQQEVIFHDSADLALVRFDKPFPSYYALYTGDFPGEETVRVGRGWEVQDNRLDAVMVGFGVTGTVSTATYSTAAWNDSSSGVKRWGTQKIDIEIEQAYSIGSMVTNNGFYMLYEQADTTYEAGVGTYDSGGGTFVEEDGVWKLAGINTIQYGESGAYTGIFAVSIPAYENWINETMDSVTGDDDSDGLPNWWEDQFSVDVLSDTDQDDDGLTGEQEYILDADPLGEINSFDIELFAEVGGQTVSFTGSTARQYQLLTSTNQFESWDEVGSPVWGEGADSSFSVSFTESNAFFCIEVLLP